MLVDVLHLLRNLRRSPVSALAAILTLSLTLGVAASIFAVVDAVLLTPPPFTNPDDVVRVGEVPVDDSAAEPRAVRFATFEAWRERAGTLAAIEAFDETNLTLTGMGAAERVGASDATPGLLPLLGVAPILGRLFDQSDVGQPVVGRTHTIVGVLPERFFFANALWRPLPVPQDADARMAQRVRVIARLASDISPQILGDTLDDVSRGSSPPSDVVVTRMATVMAGNATRTLGLLAAAATVALLVAFTNLAGLLVVRSLDRRRELALRTALGARSMEIARQFLLETLALVALGVAGGVLLASWLTPVTGRMVVERFGVVANGELALSWQVIALVSIVAAASACLCGMLLTMAATRRNVTDMLRRGATPPPRELILRRLLVTGEVTLAFVLLVSMTMLGRSLLATLDVNPGFDARGVLTMRVSLPAAVYSRNERVASFYAALQSALSDRLGPGTIAIVDELPLTGDRGRRLVGTQTDPGREAVVRVAGSDYFTVMRIPVIAGRQFDRTDDASVPPRLVVSESVAERLFGNEPVIGRRVVLSGPATEAEIVGVVGDVRHRSLDEPTAPTIYMSPWQAPSRSSHIVVRSPRPDADALGIVREETARLDGELPVYAARPMEEVVATSPGVPARRVLTAAMAGFAMLALVLGAVGLFGVAAHDVARRRSDLALRIALGAEPMRLLRATLGQGALMVGAGLVAGGVLSIGVARVVGTLAFSPAHTDPLSLVASAVVLAVTGFIAVLPAALRAARTDPLLALREE